MIHNGKQAQPVVMMEELDFEEELTGHNAALIHTDVQKHTIVLEMEKNSSKLVEAMSIRCLF